MVAIALESEVLARYPEARCSGFVAVGLAAIRFERPQPGATRQRLLDGGLSIERLAEDPRIAAWRSACRDAGLKPSTYRSSPEALIRRYLSGDEVRTPVPLVDVYCSVSAAAVAPLGAYDIDRLPQSSVDVRFARAPDEFSPIGGTRGGAGFPMSDRVVVYAAGDVVLCWGWNHRDSVETCLQSSSNAALFVGEAAVAVQYPPLEQAMAKLREVLVDGGAVVGEVVSVDASLPRAYLVVPSSVAQCPE